MDRDGPNLHIENAAVVVGGGECGGGGGGDGGGGRGSIAERRAATCGFNAERIGTPVTRSPCLTISPGISPTALLDSPVMLSNSSPLSSPYLVQKNGAEYHPPASLELDFEFPIEFPKGAIRRSSEVESVADIRGLNNTVSDNCCNLGFSSLAVASGQDAGPHILDCDQKGTNPSMEMITTSEDGYNWRKYGQKQVKGSESPRSYYKCTHPNCQVKKKVERSLDGQITEIIYKGAHNHPKPQPNRRASLGSTFSPNSMSEMAGGSQTSVKGEGGLLWRNLHIGLKDIKVVSESSNWRADNSERTSPISQASDHLLTNQGNSVGLLESAETPEFSSTLASHNDDNDDRAILQGGVLFFDDPTDDDESESKRRKTESCLTETNLASRAVREPRVVVQIESEVDILDDGYRWRKYGQKIVKGNPNPRSYYKCTNPGCSVRKHVERVSDNLKCVLTTYEGKHNHGVPAARNSCHISLSGSSMPNTQPNPVLLRDTSTSKPETQIPGIANPFNQKHEFNNGYPSPAFLGNFSNEMKCGASSIYQMKFPPLQHVSPYSPFGPNSGNSSAHSAGSVVMDFPIPLPLRLPQSVNFPLSRFDANNGKPALPAQSFLQGQQLKENDPQFLRPKLEKRDENLYNACYPIMDHANASSFSSSTVYHQVRGNFLP
ncbi:hypothetical protein SLE2022_058320 [Rubroshorea leprosula]